MILILIFHYHFISRGTPRIECGHVIHSLIGLLLLDKVVQEIPQHLLSTSSINGWHGVSLVSVRIHDSDVIWAVVKEDSDIGPCLTHGIPELTHLCLPRLLHKDQMRMS